MQAPAEEENTLAGQPCTEAERDGCQFTLLGTAHVSKASLRAVEQIVAQRDFDAIAVELCEGRYQAMVRPEQWAEVDLFRVIREGKTGMVAANLALGAYQRRLAEQLGIEPGAEMRAAIVGAKARSTALWCIDRDVGITLRRTYSAIGWWDRAKLLGGLLGSVLIDDKIEEAEVERLKTGSLLESTFGEFARRSSALFTALIGERDQYMAARLRAQARASGSLRVLAVVGAGHLAGLAKSLKGDARTPDAVTADLDALPPPSHWGVWISVILTIFVLGGFAYGFSRDAAVGTRLVLDWVLITGGLGALGCLLAGGHGLSILAAFVASPLTPLHPALASGTVSALVEATLRRPTIADFQRLRDDVMHPAGWWRNRVSRATLNFFLTSLGTAIGVYLAGWRMLDALI